MSHPTSRPDPATERDKARTQDADGPVTDAGQKLDREELRDLEEPFEPPPADEAAAETLLKEERDEENSDEEPEPSDP